MALVELKSVGKSYGAVDVIGNMDLQLDDNALTVFVGPSGCGKSTLLRMIAGLEPITRGEILIDGCVVNNETPTDRGIAMVFQNYALYPHMTVRQNIGFPLKMAGMARPEVERRVVAAVESLQIGQLLDRRPAALSGGQRQRVAIGRAIVREPRVFLFDEPLSNLDAELRVQMRLEIAKLHKQLDSTMIYVTHDQVEAMTLADKIVVLRGGRIEQAGTPLALYEDPDNVFVAGFIGSPRMNFLRAIVTAMNEDGVRVTIPDFHNVNVQLEMMGDRPSVGAEVTLGIRPEHFDRRHSVGVSMALDVIENLGGTSFGYVQTGMGSSLTIELKNERGVVACQDYQTGFDPKSILVFNHSTGKRLR